MTRKELYSKIKELNLAEVIKKKYNDNYTRISSEKLQKVVDAHICCKKSTNSTVNVKNIKNTNKSYTSDKLDVKKAIIRLLSVLQAKQVISATDAESVISQL